MDSSAVFACEQGSKSAFLLGRFRPEVLLDGEQVSQKTYQRGDVV